MDDAPKDDAGSELADLRLEYDVGTLRRDDMLVDPIEQWRSWFDAAMAADVYEPNAMVVATVDEGGWPHARNVLVKGVDERGFAFYTNYESAKAAELESAGKASALFSWLPMHRQVRVVGTVSRVSADESDAYFASRPRGSQIGAWASPQSDLIADPGVLERAVAAVTARFEGGAVPRPPFWGGYRIAPVMFEFWQGRPSRLHDRLRYVWRNGSWDIERIAP
ncbi:MAG: pyridoxamine 5'-phosphate oxidase [Actinomycetota bacterium]